jgi:hypothetical protein
MLKTGWKVGKGLGKKEDGKVDPYIVTLKFSNKGKFFCPNFKKIIKNLQVSQHLKIVLKA